MESLYQPARIQLLAATELLERGDVTGLDAVRTLARNSKILPSIRNDAAAAWAEHTERSELPALHRYISDSDIPAHARCLSAVILDRRGDPAGPSMIRELMLDERLESRLRLELASIMLSRDEQSALMILYEICRREKTPLEEKREAINTIGEHGTPAKWSILRDLATNRKIEATTRLQANYWLMEYDNSDAWTNLRELASNVQVDGQVRYKIGQLLARHGEKLGIDTMRNLTESASFEVAIDAARDLTTYGHYQSLDAIRARARAKQIDMSERAGYAWMLAVKGDQVGLDVLHQMRTRGEFVIIERIRKMLNRNN